MRGNMKHTNYGKATKYLAYCILILAVILTLIPLYWLLGSTFKTSEEAIGYPPTLFPHNPTLGNFKRLADGSSFYFGSYYHSFIVSMKTVLGVDIGGTKTSVCLGSEAGDVICKRQFLTAKEPDAVIDAIWKCGTQIMSEQSIPALSAIGISCGGPLDTHNGLILSPPHLSA